MLIGVDDLLLIPSTKYIISMAKARARDECHEEDYTGYLLDVSVQLP